MPSKKTKNDSSESFSAQVREEIISSVPKKQNERLAILAGAFTAAGEREILGEQYLEKLSDRVEGVPDIDPSSSVERRLFLRGVFISSGYFSDPEKNYRIELRASDINAVNIITHFLESENLSPSCAERGGIYAIYLKNGDDVSDYLGMIGAPVAMMKFESVRAEREVLARVNRTMNCDSGNTRRQAEAGAERNRLIRKLMDSDRAKDLSADLKEAAIINLANPGASISELGALMNPPISKSGMNHRLKKLIDIANSLD